MLALAFLGSLAALQAADPTADEILKSVDQAARNFKDLSLDLKMTIFETGGAVREVGFTQQVKGDKQIVRFNSPEDIKGMGFLLESRDTLYALLPAFGNRIRRLGANMAGQSFMGSDMLTADMFGGDYVGVWTPKLSASEGKTWTLDLELMAGKSSAFTKKKIWVDKELRRVTQSEDYDEQSKKVRTTTFAGFAKDEGGADHQSPKTTTFVDHNRKDHRTELKILSAKTDQNLPDATFTKENLKSK